MRLGLLCFSIILLLGCGESENQNGWDGIVDKNSLNYSVISDKTIVFGHKSVGTNIVDGLNRIVGQDVESSVNELNHMELSTSGFYHFEIGENRDPIGKMEAFASSFKELDGNVDIAFMKFCYVDIQDHSDVNNLFSEYQKMITQLEEEYPSTQFVHTTVPLYIDEKDFKSRIKLLLGKSLKGHKTNLKRFEFNELLRDAYSDKGTLFDLAYFESQGNGDHQLTGKVSGKTYEVLNPAFTTDGGHLNEVGSDYLAQELIRFFNSL